MLVLARRAGEQIVIGDDITIEVIEIRSGQVRLGITAPIEMPIDRLEIAESKRRSAEAGQGNGHTTKEEP